MNINKFTKLNCLKNPCNQDFSSTSFYKRTYFICNECGNQFSKDNEKIFFDKNIFIFLIKIFNKLTGWTVLNKSLVFSKETQEDSTIPYDVYSELLKKNDIKEYLKTLRQQLKRLKKNKINYKNKKILILSGGPGILAKYLSKYSDVTITEFSQKSVAAMKEYLNLNAIQIDFNNENDFKKITGNYDLIISESNINYCEDQKRFLFKIDELLTKSGTLILSNDKPAFGYMLSWMYHDYMPSIFLTLENILLILNQKSKYEFIAIERNKYNALKYRSSRSLETLLRFIILLPITIIYVFKLLNPFRNLIRKWWSLNEFVYIKKN